MAIKLIANYAKRLGLPGYSSHQFSVSVETELREVGEIGSESQRLYATLQAAVDEQIQITGFVPPDGYGMEGSSTHSVTSHSANAGTTQTRGSNGNGSRNGNSANGTWACSDKQRELIEKIVSENNLDKQEVEALAQEMFGTGVKALNRLSASGLIDRLLEQYGTNHRANNGTASRRRYAGKATR